MKKTQPDLYQFKWTRQRRRLGKDALILLLILSFCLAGLGDLFHSSVRAEETHPQTGREENSQRDERVSEATKTDEAEEAQDDFAAEQSETLAPIHLDPQDKSLRLWWETRTTMNPLHTFDASGKAAMSLAYRGLFRLDEQERLRLDLLESAEWSDDHLSLSLNLRRDESFSDGSPLRARDAAVSLLVYRSALLSRMEMPEFSGNGQMTDLSQAENEAGLEDVNLYAHLPGLSQPLDLLEEADNAVEGELPVRIPAYQAKPGQTEKDEQRAEEKAENPENTEVDTEADEDGKRNPFDGLRADFSAVRPDPEGRRALASIERVLILSPNSFRIELKSWAENLPWVLTFPIIPEAYALSDSLKEVPGIGRYRLSLDEKTGMGRAVAQGDLKGKAADLLFLPYDSEEAALSAFEEGKLDLLYLDEQTSQEMLPRHHLNRSLLQGLNYSLMVCGKGAYSPFADAQTLQTFRAFLTSRPQGSPVKGDAAFCYHRRDWRRLSFNETPAQRQQDSLTQLDLLLGKMKLVLAAPASPFGRTLMNRLAEQLSQLSCQLELKYIPLKDYADYLAQGEYALALTTVPLSYPLDLRAMSNQLNENLKRTIFSLPTDHEQGGLPRDLFYRFEPGQNDAAPEALQAEMKALQEALLKAGLFEVGFSESCLLFSPDLKGSLSSSEERPYEGIEKLSVMR